MPMVQISMVEGRDSSLKAQLIKAVTDAITETLEVPAERVHIFIHDIPATNCGTAGVTVAQHQKELNSNQ